MINFLLSLAKVCFRHGEEIINFIQEVIQEVKGNSPESKELSEMEKEMLESEEVD